MKCNVSLQKMKQADSWYRRMYEKHVFSSCLCSPETSQPSNLRDVALELGEGGAAKWC